MRKLSLVLSLLLLVSAVLCGPALAAQDITDWVYEYLTTDVAYISLYEPTEKRVPLGELIFNDLSQAVEMAFGAGNVVPVKSLSLADMPAAEELSEEEEAEPEETVDPVVPEGYVLVSLLCEGREEILACMPEEFARSPAERRAEEAEAGEEEPVAEEGEEEAEAMPEPLPEPEEEPAEEAVRESEATRESAEKKALFSQLSRRELILVLVILLLLFAAILELALLLVYRRRAENLAKSYLRLKGQTEKMKRELASAKNSRMQMDRELVKLRGRMAGLEEGEESAPAQEERPADGGFILPDYADWKF